MNRRKFLIGTTALFCAPAIVRSESLMKIYVPEIWTPSGITREALRVLHYQITLDTNRIRNFEESFAGDRYFTITKNELMTFRRPTKYLI